MTDEPELILWTWTGDDPPADMRPDPAVTQHVQPLTLNQRAHLLSAEFGVTPREALEWLQGEWQ